MDKENIKEDDDVKSIEHPISEITLRKYEKPSDDIERRDLIKKICLSLGLLQPNDSRDIVIDIFHVLVDTKGAISTKTIMKRVEEGRMKYKLSNLGLTYPNVCRQLRRLKQLEIIECKADKYRLNEGNNLREIFNEKIMKYYIASIQDRINEYLDKI